MISDLLFYTLTSHFIINCSMFVRKYLINQSHSDMTAGWHLLPPPTRHDSIFPATFWREGQNFKQTTWKHGSILSCVNGSGWHKPGGGGLFVSTAYMISDGYLGQENPSYHKALRFFSTLLNLTPTQIADIVPFPIIVFCYPY